MRLARTCALAALVFSLSGTAASADPITFIVHGTVNEFVQGSIPDGVSVGSPFTMRLIWESSTLVLVNRRQQRYIS